MNVAQKFSREGGHDHLRRFFAKLSTGTIRAEYDSERQVLEVGVENNLERRELETRAKDHGYALNFKNNREIVVVPAQLFFEIVEDLLGGPDVQAESVYQSVGSEIARQVGGTERRERLEVLSRSAGQFTRDVIVGIATSLLQQATR
jgi:hypothetical protein